MMNDIQIEKVQRIIKEFLPIDPDQGNQRDNQRKNRKKPDKVKKHFERLAKSVEKAHEVMVHAARINVSCRLVTGILLVWMISNAMARQ